MMKLPKMNNRLWAISPKGFAELQSMVDSLAAKNVELTARNEDLENVMRIMGTIPKQPDESPAKKTFKVVGSPTGETEV